jgi:hypothetical protein
MKARFNQVQRRRCRQFPFRERLDGRPKAQRQDRRERVVQLIYAHIPPAAILAADKHLRAQTNFEQRVQQCWLDQDCRTGAALGDWIRAECAEVQKLCQALLSWNAHGPESSAIST